MGYIEELLGDQPPRGRRADAPREPDSSEPAPPAIQAAFEGVRKAVEGACKAVLDLRAQEGRELADQYQRLQREYLASADAREHALAERIADLEAASSGAGDESWESTAVVEELRSALQAAISERDAEQARVDESTVAHQLALAQLATAEAHVQAAHTRVSAQAADIGRLTRERDDLADTATRAAHMGLENVALHERVAVLSEQVTCFERLIRDMEDRHQQEREHLRAHYEQELKEARRQRPVALLGAPFPRDDRGERG
jgi:chromosome segregation ATPase